MKSLPERIMGYAEAEPEATPIRAEDLLHLGDRACRAPGALPPHAFRSAHADLPWHLHAPDPDPNPAFGPRAANWRSPPCPNYGA